MGLFIRKTKRMRQVDRGEPIIDLTINHPASDVSDKNLQHFEDACYEAIEVLAKAAEQAHRRKTTT
jgi:hypothetical protein